MSGHDEAIAHFVAKWHRREPEMAQAEVFCPEGQRLRFRAWGALVHELREAGFELSDVRVSAVKGQWWAEELANLTDGRSRHPVTAPLLGADADWPRLGQALMRQVVDEQRPADAAQTLGQVMPLASALAEVEAAVFGARAGEHDARALAVHLLLQRLPSGLAADDQALLPMNLLARHGLTAAQVAAGQGEPLLRDWAAALAAELPEARAHDSLFRRLRSGFDRARLARLAKGRGFDPPGPVATLLRAWRLARRA